MRRTGVLITGDPESYVIFEDISGAEYRAPEHPGWPRTVVYDRNDCPMYVWWRERASNLIYPELATPPQPRFRSYYARMDGQDPGDED